VSERVVIVGVKRAGQMIPVRELKQMCGRCGRSHDVARAKADIIVEEDVSEEVKKGLREGGKEKVSSGFGDLGVLAFHVISEICSGKVKDEESFLKWYLRSLHSFQGGFVRFEDVAAFLESMGAAKWASGRLVATNVSRIAASLYFHPADVVVWRDNFTTLFRLGLERDDVAVAWALGNVPLKRVSGDFASRWDAVREFSNRIPLSLTFNDGGLVTATLWWHLMGGPPVGPMRTQALELRQDFGRIHRMLMMLDKYECNWKMSGFFDDLQKQVRKGIPAELVSLCKVAGIGKGRASHLYNMGLKTADDVLEHWGSVEEEFGNEFVESIKKEVCAESGDALRGRND
jgi:replicative superfamily II helicase